MRLRKTNEKKIYIYTLKSRSLEIKTSVLQFAVDNVMKTSSLAFRHIFRDIQFVIKDIHINLILHIFLLF